VPRVIGLAFSRWQTMLSVAIQNKHVINDNHDR
jgi:hypothetical protein